VISRSRSAILRSPGRLLTLRAPWRVGGHQSPRRSLVSIDGSLGISATAINRYPRGSYSQDPTGRSALRWALPHERARSAHRKPNRGTRRPASCRTGFSAAVTAVPAQSSLARQSPGEAPLERRAAPSFPTEPENSTWLAAFSAAPVRGTNWPSRVGSRLCPHLGTLDSRDGGLQLPEPQC
jgi:hypothetical protein